MFARIAGQPLELYRHIPDFLRRAIFLEQLHQLIFLLQRLGQGHPHLERDQFRNAVCQPVGLTLYPGDIADHRFGGHRAEGDDLRHRLTAIGLRHIFNDFVAALHAEVHVEVRHRDPLGIQEALEQQVVFDRIEVGDLQCIRHQRSGTGASTGTDRDILIFGPANKVHDHQEVPGETHLVDGRELELQSLPIGYEPLLIPIREASLEPLVRQATQIRFDCLFLGNRKVGQKRLAQRQ